MCSNLSFSRNIEVICAKQYSLATQENGGYSMVNYSCADGFGLSFNTVTKDYWDSSGDDARSHALATALLTLCIILVGLPNNLLIVVSILRQHLYREPTYILLLNLALIDLLLCFFLMPSPVVSGLAGEFVFGRNDVTRCKVCQMGIVLPLFVELTIHTLVLLSLDRLIFIKYPMKYHKFVTAKRVIIIVFIIWTSNIVISTFPLFGFGDFVYIDNLATCVPDLVGETRLTKTRYFPVFLAFETFISLIFLFVANIWVGFIVQKHIKQIYSLKKNISINEDEFVNEIKERMAKTKNMKHLQLIKVMASILVANIMTWIPFIVYVCYSFFKATTNTPTVIVYISIIAAVAVHPVIQVSLVPELRKHFVAFYNICLCCFNKSRPRKLSSCFEKCPRKLKCMDCHCLYFFSHSFLPNVDELDRES